MILTQDQQNAKEAIGRWLKDDDQWMFYLGGFAGTGKTTLLHEMINSLDKEPMCLAPTGKAASVLQKRLNNAKVKTIHSAIYKPIEPDTRKLEMLEMRLADDPESEKLKQLVKEEKQVVAKQKIKFSDNMDHAIVPGQLVIVDEASMVSTKMIDDLENTKAKLLFVGDPGQLPPVKDSGYFTYTRPDAMLSEIVRQAADNPIIDLSMRIRKGLPIPETMENSTVLKRPKKGYDISRMNEYDQILTGTNVMRRKLNRIVRKLLGREESVMPVKGDRLICLKNQYKFGTWLINGIQCVATSDADVNNEMDFEMDMLYEGDSLLGVPFYAYPFQATYRQDCEEEPWSARKNLSEFDYGYAVTVHKSQGSEWDKVALVDDEIMKENREFRKRWLYTAVTRAKGNLTWLTNN